MRMSLFRSLFSIPLIFFIFLSPPVSLSGGKEDQDKTLEYLKKMEEFILEVVPEGQGERVKELFDKLREFLKKEFGVGEEPGPVEETIWKEGRYLYI